MAKSSAASTETAHSEPTSDRHVARLIQRAKTDAGLTHADLGNVVGIGTRQVQNWAAGRGTPASGARLRRLLDLNYILDLIAEVYGDEGAVTWLQARNRLLEGRRPLDLIAEGKPDEVIDLLDRLADGNF